MEPSRFKIPLKAMRLKVGVKNPEGSIHRPFTYIKHCPFFLIIRSNDPFFSSSLCCQILSFNDFQHSTESEKSFASLLPKVGRTTFAKEDPTMQRCFGFLMELIFVGCIVFSSFNATFVFALSVLRPSMFFQCCVFVFGCAHNNFADSLCFRGFFYLFFVVHAIMLMLHCISKVFTIVVCL